MATVTVHSKKELQELRDKFKALEQARSAINDSRVSSDIKGQLVGSAEEVDNVRKALMNKAYATEEEAKRVKAMQPRSSNTEAETPEEERSRVERIKKEESEFKQELDELIAVTGYLTQHRGEEELADGVPFKQALKDARKVWKDLKKSPHSSKYAEKFDDLREALTEMGIRFKKEEEKPTTADPDEGELNQDYQELLRQAQKILEEIPRPEVMMRKPELPVGKHRTETAMEEYTQKLARYQELKDYNKHVKQAAEAHADEIKRMLKAIEERYEAKNVTYHGQILDLAKQIRMEGSKKKYEKKGKGFVTTNAGDLKMSDNGTFGNLNIDTRELMRYNLVVRDEQGNVVMRQNHVDKSTVDLLTKRFSAKATYSPMAIETFRTLLQKSGLPMMGRTRKLTLLGKRGGCLPENITVPKAVERMKVLCGEIDAGNNAPAIRSEIGDLLFYLRENGKLTKPQMTQFYKTFVAGN